MNIPLISFIISLILSFQPAHLCHSQDHRFISVKNEIFDGSLDCNKIIEDSLSFIWFGTSNGLYRYDGFNTTIFQHDLKDSNSIHHNLISDIIQDGSNIYISAWGNGPKICKISMVDHSIKRITIKNDLNTAHRVLCKVSNGAYILTGDKGIAYIRDINKNCSFINLPSARYIHQSSIHELIIAASNKLYYYNIEEDSLNPNYTIQVKGSITSSEYLNGVSVFGSTQGLFSLENSFKIPIELKALNISCLKFDSQNNLWIGTKENGLYCWKISENSIKQYKSSLIPGSLGSNSVNCLLEDKNKLLWIGTSNGPFILDLKNNGISQIPLIDSTPLNNNTLPLFQEDNGILWVAQPNYINFYNPIKRNYLPKKLLIPNVSMIINDNKKDSFWISSWGYGLYHVAKNKFTQDYEIIKRFHFNEKSNIGISSNQIMCILKDSAENLWVGNYYKGVDILSKNGKWTHLDPEQIIGNAVSQIIQSSNKTIWIGTLNAGLTKCVIDLNGTFTFKNYSTKNSNLAYNVITSIVEDHSNQLWIGTFGGGLFKFDPINETFTSFSIKEGLPSNNIYTVECDKNNNLWCSTANGLAHLETDHLKFRIFKTANRIPSNNFSFFSSVIFKNGEIAFGSSLGIALINVDSIKKIQNLQNPIVSKIKLFNKDLLPNSINSIQVIPNLVTDLQLPFDKDLLSFEFSNKYYTHPELVEYSYYLEGFDKDWIYCGKSNIATFTRLPPGKYKLNVRSSINQGGSFNYIQNPVHITIFPPWWQTWWFRSIIISSSISLIYWIFKLRTQKLLAIQRIEIEKQTALENERTRIARDMHDDLGSGLSAIHLLSNYLKENVEHKYPEFITEINKIIQSSGDLNQSVREIIWTINTTDDTLHSLVMFVLKYCNELNEKTKTNIEVNAPDPIPKFQLTGDQRKHLFLCVKESINNALKHSKATAIEISFSLTNQNNMSIHIIDNGIGFDADISENLKQGNGLINIKQRMKEIGGNVDISSNSNGTQITLDIPLPFSLS